MLTHSLQILKCDVCQRMNRKLTTGTPELHPIPVKAPWHQIGIDFIGPLSPEADDGSRYILTVSDYFTKWVEAIPTIDKSASSVATALFKVCVYAVCTVIAVSMPESFYVCLPRVFY